MRGGNECWSVLIRALFEALVLYSVPCSGEVGVEELISRSVCPQEEVRRHAGCFTTPPAAREEGVLFFLGASHVGAVLLSLLLLSELLSLQRSSGL